MIYESRGDKPIVGILSECAFSAAYAIASACDFITVPRTGGTGSIGVVAFHIDQSRALEEAGLTVTLVQYGDKKTNGTDTQPLSTEAFKELQACVDTMGEMFVDTVARNRDLSAKKVRAQQAGIFTGAAGIDEGLADKLLAPHDAFRQLQQIVR